MIIDPSGPERRFFAPEVVQTSAMDCGPAALKSILEGFHIPVSYGRLREACQTDVDGTSINTVEDLALQLGLQAEQVMLPVDHLGLPEAQALPAIVVVQRPSGLTHFLVVWRRVGNFLQVMDPATGRRWPTWKRFQEEVYVHTFPVPVEAWREWAGSEGLLLPLMRRLRDLEAPEADITRLIESAAADPGWRSLATLDAATRMTAALAAGKGIARGEQAARVLEQFYRLNLNGPLPRMEKDAPGPGGPDAPKTLVIPNLYWSVLPAVETEAQAAGLEPVERLLLRGAVLVRILGARGRTAAPVESTAEQEAEKRVSKSVPSAVDETAGALGPTESVLEPAAQTSPPSPLSEAKPASERGDQEAAALPPLSTADLAVERGSGGEVGQADLAEESRAERAALPPDLQAALEEPTYRPEKAVWDALRQDGLLTPAALGLALFLATLGVLIEALLFQGLIRVGQSFTLVSQKALAALALLAFVAALLLIELPISATVLRMGRRLEARLRIAFLEKIPRLGDRYFRSRLTSDMTQRAYDLRALRNLPSLGSSVLRTAFQLILTTIGVIWLDPVSAPLALLGTGFFVGLSFLTRPFIEERDLRLRTHTGALSRFYLDALLGLVPVRTHGAERAMRRQHEAQLYEWVRTGRETYTVANVLQAVGALLYSGFAILILVNYLLKGGQANEILLLFYWTLSLPALGQSLADSLQQYPMQRNMLLRLLEPLSAPDEEAAWAAVQADGRDGVLDAHSQKDGRPGQNGSEPSSNPVGIGIAGVTLQAGGHVILQDVSLEIAPGEHIAIVGPSGAGKSSLVGLLLGWHRPSQGEIRVDGEALDGVGLLALRRATAWVDPAVQLWNQSLYDNLRYGMQNRGAGPIGEVIQSADLYDVLERLPEGLKTDLGEGGGLVSGGEGQRVRLGRAMLRSDVRLVILDEPFRGLDREKRGGLLRAARRHWQGQTLLCITHDIGETQSFPRVLVIENGQIVEDAAPEALAANPNSRYRAILAAEQAVRQELWESAEWRRLWIDKGILEE